MFFVVPKVFSSYSKMLVSFSEAPIFKITELRVVSFATLEMPNLSLLDNKSKEVENEEFILSLQDSVIILNGIVRYGAYEKLIDFASFMRILFMPIFT